MHTVCEREMSVSFRIDDVYPEIDWERFEYFLTMIREFNVKPLLGGVPNTENPRLKKNDIKNDFWDNSMSFRRMDMLLLCMDIIMYIPWKIVEYFR